MAFKKPREACGHGDAHRSSKGKVEGAGQACKGSMGAKEMGHGSWDTCVCWQCVQSDGHRCKMPSFWPKLGVGVGQGYFPGEGIANRVLEKKPCGSKERSREGVAGTPTSGNKGQLWEERQD